MAEICRHFCRQAKTGVKYPKSLRIIHSLKLERFFYMLSISKSKYPKQYQRFNPTFEVTTKVTTDQKSRLDQEGGPTNTTDR